MKVYVTRENLRLDGSLDDTTLLDIVRLLNAKSNLDSVTTGINQDLAGHEESVVVINEGRPINLQCIMKDNDQRVSLRYIIGDCVRIPYRGKRLFLSCDNHNKYSFVLIYRPGYRLPYVPYKIRVACLDNTTLCIGEALGCLAKIGDI